MEQVVELVPFLRDTKKEVRTIAIQNLAAFSSAPEAQELLIKEEKLIPSLRILLFDIDYIAREAYVCFLQFSSNTTFAHKMIDANLIPVLMETICDEESLFIEVALLILANLTRVQEGSEALLQQGTEFEGVFVYKLIQKFYTGDRTVEPKEDKFKWIASIVTNLSQLEKGRDLLTKDDAKLLMLIASANISTHSARTRGIAATIKNCCFCREPHMNLLEKGLLNFIVVPLMAGPEDFTLDEVENMPIAAKTILMQSHTMEKDKETQLSLLGAIILLCSSRKTRQFLRDSSVYPIIREFDRKQKEEEEEVKEEVVRIVEFLVRDEASEVEEVTKEEEDDDVESKIGDLALD